MRAGIGTIFLIVSLFGCHSKTKATADLLASLDTELARTEAEAYKCLRGLDERSEILARKLSLLHDTHQRTMFRHYANVVPLVRAEASARKSFDVFFDQQRRCQELVSHGVALSVWLPHREHPKATADCGRASSRSGERVKKP